MTRKLIAEYRQTLKLTKAQYVKTVDESERKIIAGMLTDLKLAIQWLQCGYDPTDTKAGIHKVEQKSSYHNRRRLLDMSFFSSKDFLPSLDDEQELSYARTISNEEKESIQEALHTLTKAQINCYILHFGYMRTHDEIAIELRLSKSTVQTHIERAKDKIVQTIKDKEVSA